MAQKGKKLWGKYLQSTIRRIKIIFQVSAIRTTRLCPAMSGKFSHTANEATRTWVKISEQPDIKTKYGRRDLAILSLMYDTGARVQEIADIKIVHIRFSAPATIRITGKGDKTRVVPLLSRTEDILKQYIKDFKIDAGGNDAYLFQNRSGQQLSRFGISYILTKYADMARKVHPELIPEKLSPHCIRHSKAMHLLQANVNLVYIRDLLGHSSVTTTEIYARADTTLKREALEKANPAMPQWNSDDGLMEWLRTLGK